MLCSLDLAGGMGRAEGQDRAAFEMMALVTVEKVLDAINWP